MIRLVPVLALVAVLAACGPQQKAETDAETPTAVVSTPDGTVSVTTPGGQVNVSDGSAVVGGQQPAFAPAYPGGEVVTTMSATENGKRGGVYAFTTGDAPDKVFQFYRARAEAAGLASQTNVEAGGSRIYGAQGAAGDLAVTAAPQGDQTYVQITWSTPAA